MSSGVTVADNCLDVFQELKLKKKFKYILYKLNADNTEVVVEKTAEQASYDEFIKSLPIDGCRYAIYDLEYEKPGEGLRNKICFYAWSPDSAKIKSKMVYAASKDALRKKLVGIAAEIQCTDLAEVSYDAVLDKVTRATS
ncbi:putative COF1-cofilin [Paraphysoderma sedebokerense]|nr:putative COF1-cofilin [Paraphysoderma sedebokerense]